MAIHSANHLYTCVTMIANCGPSMWPLCVALKSLLSCRKSHKSFLQVK